MGFEQHNGGVCVSLELDLLGFCLESLDGWFLFSDATDKLWSNLAVFSIIGASHFRFECLVLEPLFH